MRCFGLFFIALWCCTVAHAQSTDELIAVWEKTYGNIVTIRVDGEYVIKPVMDERYLYETHGFVDWGDQQDYVISHRDGRVRHWQAVAVGNRSVAVYEALLPRYPDLRGKNIHDVVPHENFMVEFEKAVNVPPASTLFVFDGDRLYRHREAVRAIANDGTARKSFGVLNTDREAHYLPTSILDRLLFGFAMPGLRSENSHRRKNRIPDVFDDNAVETSLETFDGAECVAVEVGTGQRIIFDPNLGHAVVHRQWLRKGIPLYEFTAIGHEEVMPSLWLPSKIVATNFADDRDADGQDAGKPRYEFHINLDWEVNQPEHLDAFSIDIPVGSFVVDHELRPIDVNQQPVPHAGNSYVTYVQPADEEDVNRVIAQAQLQQGEQWAKANNKPELPKRSFSSMLIWFNLGLVLILFIGWLYKRRSS